MPYVVTDFGAVGSFSTQMRKTWRELMHHMMNGDVTRMVNASISLSGPLPPVDVARRQIVLRGQTDGAVEGDPAHDFRMRKMLRRAPHCSPTRADCKSAPPVTLPPERAVRSHPEVFRFVQRCNPPREVS